LTRTTANSSLLSAVNCEMSRRQSSLIPELAQDGIRKKISKERQNEEKNKRKSKQL
jgi:hypothetical protein